MITTRHTRSRRALADWYSNKQLQAFSNDVPKRRMDIIVYKVFSEFITHSQAHESVFHISSFHTPHIMMQETQQMEF